MKKKFVIYGEKHGQKKEFTTEIGEEAAEEEVTRLNKIKDGITYTKEFVENIPEHPQTNVMY